MTRPDRRILPGTFALVVALSVPVQAQPKPPAGTESVADDSNERRAHALQLFDKSVALYEGGRFREAASLLEEAYATFPEPVLLYNLARAYQESGELAKAIDAYERFLAADPDVKDREGIEQRVVTLREQLRSAERPKAATTATAAKTPDARASKPANDARTTGAAKDEGGSTGSIVPWVIAGTGVVALGTGVALGVVAKGHHGDAEKEENAIKAQSEQERAENFALASNVTLVAGGVLAAVGTAWGVVVLASGSGGASAESRAKLAVGPRSVRFSLRF
jgi:tetratricopeptide (TPR) repeat protein